MLIVGIFGAVVVSVFFAGQNDICVSSTQTTTQVSKFYDVSNSPFGYLTDINGNSGGSTSYNLGGGEQNGDNSITGKKLTTITLYFAIINSQFNNATFSYPADYIGSLKVGVYDSNFNLVSLYTPTSYDTSTLPWAHSSDDYTTVNNALAVNFTGNQVLSDGDIIGYKFNGTLTNHAPDYITLPLLVDGNFGDASPLNVAIKHKNGIVSTNPTDVAGKFYETVTHTVTTTPADCKTTQSFFTVIVVLALIIILLMILLTAYRDRD